MIPAGSRSTASRRPCRVCELPASERDLLEHGLLYGWSARALAARFGSVTRKKVAHHQRNCVASEAKEEV
jgi:hypothetical protein